MRNRAGTRCWCPKQCLNHWAEGQPSRSYYHKCTLASLALRQMECSCVELGKKKTAQNRESHAPWCPKLMTAIYKRLDLNVFNPDVLLAVPPSDPPVWFWCGTLFAQSFRLRWAKRLLHGSAVPYTRKNLPYHFLQPLTGAHHGSRVRPAGYAVMCLPFKIWPAFIPPKHVSPEKTFIYIPSGRCVGLAEQEIRRMFYVVCVFAKCIKFWNELNMCYPEIHKVGRIS